MVGRIFSRIHDSVLFLLVLAVMFFTSGCGGHTSGTNPPTKLLSIDTIALNSNGEPVAGVQITNSFGETAFTNEEGEASLEAALGSDLTFSKDGLTTVTAVIPTDPDAAGIVYAVEVREEEIVVVEQGEVVPAKKDQGEDPLVPDQTTISDEKDNKPKDRNNTPPPSAPPTPEPTPDLPEPEALALVEGTLPNVEDGAPSNGAYITVNGSSATTENGVFSIKGVVPLFNASGAPVFEVAVYQKSGDSKFTVTLPLGFDFNHNRVELAFNYRPNKDLGYRLRTPERETPIKVPEWGKPDQSKPNAPDKKEEEPPAPTPVPTPNLPEEPKAEEDLQSPDDKTSEFGEISLALY